jgi:hypothetical protein
MNVRLESVSVKSFQTGAGRARRVRLGGAIMSRIGYLQRASVPNASGPALSRNENLT